MSEAWDLNELANLATAERRPLSRSEKLDLREARCHDRECGLANKERLLKEQERAQGHGWADLGREQGRLLRWKRNFYVSAAFLAVVEILFAFLLMQTGNRTLPRPMSRAEQAVYGVTR